MALGLCGLRVGEALGIRRSGDLDFENRVIHVCQKVIRHPGVGSVIELPKMGKTRDVPMPEWIVPLLRAQLEWSLKIHNQTDLLFTTLRGQPLYDLAVHKYLRAACAEAGIEYRDFHSLRHTYGTLLLAAGENPVEIAASMGHQDPALLMRLYGNHLTYGREKRLAGALDRLFGENVAKNVASGAE